MPPAHGLVGVKPAGPCLGGDQGVIVGVAPHPVQAEKLQAAVEALKSLGALVGRKAAPSVDQVLRQRHAQHLTVVELVKLLP
eukprot:CAMPEP_0204588314 /NCGR_PEP_ID=MMETSP0661-20131031/48552_1 /ASSEMBLY_ACC=CAM_ASM_000606 /TAXON_ID=109239 /ORGANISM="Alexandrium margalefi, Strain AMGDE01CS-322" /LENGTH=81 /DNA_ID=CAMNT_0051598119 /DNA_START=331 /DNA_END=576 /DNA_ORIENTATION=-